MSEERERPQRSALWLSMMLTLMGSCGACNATSQYVSGTVPSREVFQTQQSAGARAEAEAELNHALAATFIGSPYRRPLALANLVVSLMLIGGSFMVGMRHASTRWFVTNALVANLLFIAVDGGLGVARVESARHVLTPKLVTWAQTLTTAEGPVSAADARTTATLCVLMIDGAIAAFALAKLGFHVLLLRRLRGEDVGRFLAARAED